MCEADFDGPEHKASRWVAYAMFPGKVGFYASCNEVFKEPVGPTEAVKLLREGLARFYPTAPGILYVSPGKTEAIITTKRAYRVHDNDKLSALSAEEMIAEILAERGGQQYA